MGIWAAKYRHTPGHKIAIQKSIFILHGKILYKILQATQRVSIEDSKIHEILIFSWPTDHFDIAPRNSKLSFPTTGTFR